MDYDKIITTMRRLAIEAGAEIMDVYAKPDFDVQVKSDASPVTEADQRADRVISDGLRAAFPGIALVTEEQAASHDVAADVFFIVDPLDGTKEFIKRGGDFTVNIALVEHGVPTRGVVFAPAKERMFWTDPTGRTVEETGNVDPGEAGPTHPLSVSQPGRDLTIVASKSHRDAATDAYISKYPIKAFQSAGSSLKFCLVAAGEADLYPRLGRTMEWDTAAGDAVLRGAGGRMVDFDGHETFKYGKPGYENGFFIACAPEVPLMKSDD